MKSKYLRQLAGLLMIGAFIGAFSSTANAINEIEITGANIAISAIDINPIAIDESNISDISLIAISNIIDASIIQNQIDAEITAIAA